MIDVKALKELIKLMIANDLTELDLQEKDERVTIKRGGGAPAVHYVPSAPAPAPAPAAGTPEQPGAAPAPEEQPGVVTIGSPMVGTFYNSPTPDAQSYVKVGDRVEPDTVVCIIEAMKVFNEIRAQTAGTIQKVLVKNGEAIEFDQPLFAVKPD